MQQQANKRFDPPLPGRWMGIDPGTISIGVAISDPLRITVRPLATIRRLSLELDAARLLELVREHDVQRIVVGCPRHLGGEPSALQQRLAPLVEEIRSQAGIPVVWGEERLSSKEAEQLMAELGFDPKERRQRRDEFAAALILRWHLEEGGRAFGS